MSVDLCCFIMEVKNKQTIHQNLNSAPAWERTSYLLLVSSLPGPSEPRSTSVCHEALGSHVVSFVVPWSLCYESCLLKKGVSVVMFSSKGSLGALCPVSWWVTCTEWPALTVTDGWVRGLDLLPQVDSIDSLILKSHRRSLCPCPREGGAGKGWGEEVRRTDGELSEGEASSSARLARPGPVPAPVLGVLCPPVLVLS